MSLQAELLEAYEAKLAAFPFGWERVDCDNNDMLGDLRREQIGLFEEGAQLGHIGMALYRRYAYDGAGYF